MEPSSIDTSTRSVLRRIHIVATAWFVACAGYLLVDGLRRAGFNWWLVLSLSGYSTSMLLLLVCLYLFAFVHGVRGMRRTRAEHPVTGTGYYMFPYVSTPLLASLCAATEIDDTSRTNGHLIYIATMTLKATFLAWIVIDPLAGFIEMRLSASRSHRAIRKK
jgi:hypothetical protein